VSRFEKLPPDIMAQLPALLPRLWRLGLSLSGKRDIAEDLAQSACRRAIERRHQFVAGTRLDSWVFAILVSIWRNERRTEAIRARQSLADATDAVDFVSTSDPETALYHKQVVAEVGRLPEAQRETVMLVYVEGLSYAEAASVLDVPIGTIMSRLAAARLKLAARLAETPVKSRAAAE
jgi:RNA polymerase sigma-70 factor (ECF subfamily)